MKKVVIEISGRGRATIDTALIERITKIKEQAKIDTELAKECKTESIITTSEFERFDPDKEKKNKNGKTKKNWE